MNTKKINETNLNDLKDLTANKAHPGTVYVTTLSWFGRLGGGTKITGVYLDPDEAIMEMKGPYLRLLAGAEAHAYNAGDLEAADDIQEAQNRAQSAAVLAPNGGYLSCLGTVPGSAGNDFSPGVEFYAKVEMVHVGRPTDLAYFAADVETKDLETV